MLLTDCSSHEIKLISSYFSYLISSGYLQCEKSPESESVKVLAILVDLFSVVELLTYTIA